jgi:hypothetical protein
VSTVTRTGAPSTPLPVAAAPRVLGWLRSAPGGPVDVLHQCGQAVHVGIGGRCVSVLAATAPGLPNSLRTALSRVTTGAVPTPYVEDGTLHLDGRALVTGRLVDVRAPRLDPARVPQTSPADIIGIPRPCPAGLVALPDRVTPATVWSLVGRGDGLTPLGDDVMCGWLAGHRALGVATPAVDDVVRRLLPRTTTLSATLLECAMEGEVADALADLIRALGTTREPGARAVLAAVGHSSGAGLAHGLDLALADLVGGRSAA